MLLLGLLALVFTQPAHAQSKARQIQSGALVDRGWNYAAGNPLKLEGEWEVIWGKLVAPSDFDAEYTGDLFEIPGRWNNVGHPAMNGAYGVATFRAQA